MSLMLVPGRTLDCLGSADRILVTVSEVFQQDGFELLTLPGTQPTHLRSGSETLGVLGMGSELFLPLMLIPGVRKKAFPTKVSIHVLEQTANTCRVRIESRTTSSSSRFTITRFTALLDTAIARIEAAGALVHAGELTDSALG